MKKGYKDIGEETIKARTGKSWSQWQKILDKYNVKEKGHTTTAKMLKNRYMLSPWWSQVITVKHEYQRGLRE